jgi:polyisoprenoid-binding protein YceI
MTTTATRTYTIDPKHTSVGFSIRHLMIAKVRGSFGSVAGTVELGASGFIPTAVTAEIEIASIDTREAQRDGHLKSPDFFDVENHPTMRFTSTKIVPEGDTGFSLTGELEIRGSKQSVTFEAEVSGHGKDPFGQGERVAYEAKTKIKRSAFGLTWNAPMEAGGVMLGDDIEITLDVEVVG